MRAFDDICVTPGFVEDASAPKAKERVVVAAVVCAAIAVGSTVALGTFPEVPGLDT